MICLSDFKNRFYCFFLGGITALLYLYRSLYHVLIEIGVGRSLQYIPFLFLEIKFCHCFTKYGKSTKSYFSNFLHIQEICRIKTSEIAYGDTFVCYCHFLYNLLVFFDTKVNVLKKSIFLLYNSSNIFLYIFKNFKNNYINFINELI